MNALLRRLTPALMGLVLAGCGGTVMAPNPDAAKDTRPVFLLDHGRHANLVLTRADGTLVRYLYGDWRWYAQGDTAFLRTVPTLFAATPSALGRQVLAGPATAACIRRQVRREIQDLYPLSAAGARIDRLDRGLQEYFAQMRAQAHYNAALDVEFVPGERPYTLFGNSNHVVAEWLEALDVEVRGNPVFGGWRIAGAEAQPG